MGLPTQFSFEKLRKGGSPERKMRHLGSYQGKECYEVSRVVDIPKDEENIYVLGTNGTMYFSNVIVGKLNVNSYRVLEFDLEPYYRKKQKEKEKEKTVAVPVSVAAATTSNLAIGEEMDLTGTDEFFARIALDIDEVLKSVNVKESETWNFV